MICAGDVLGHQVEDQLETQFWLTIDGPPQRVVHRKGRRRRIHPRTFPDKV